MQIKSAYDPGYEGLEYVRRLKSVFRYGEPDSGTNLKVDGPMFWRQYGWGDVVWRGSGAGLRSA